MSINSAELENPYSRPKVASSVSWPHPHLCSLVLSRDRCLAWLMEGQVTIPSSCRQSLETVSVDLGLLPRLRGRQEVGP